ncbi:major facilitator superfamily domain-containing protein [Lineolata rhizophorae]|uniref:Major facilitator superfamily domain-containing protein n=1 Tax=Lineolata rhizophorae TaxID=578093 RepID=A0A6A6NPH6_9PEZI|nr:major facilitator superfamily domain-containing protein [Lineolata rhizophorae]
MSLPSFLEKHRDPTPVDEDTKKPIDSEANINVQEQRSDDSERISEDVQAGVQAIQATATVWTTTALIIAYIMIFIIYFVDSMQQNVTAALNPYVTSSFALHSLTAATNIMSNIIGGLFKLPLAKILDIWGRPQGYFAMIVVLTVGIVMMAGCNNVETYAAAQVFYWVGYNGLGYSLSIFIADTSSLKNRALMFAYSNSPYIATVWIGGPIAESVLGGAGWRWGFGIFAIVTPAVTLPLWGLLAWNHNKAKKLGIIHRRNSGRTFLQSVKYYAIEFDLFGLILIAGGLALFLLPFSLYTYQGEGWRAPMIICMIIFGGLLLIGFGLWEKYWAPKTFLPYDLLTDRTVLGACILSGVLFVAWYIWNAYFSSFLQVVNDLSVTEASYVTRIYTIGSCFWAVVVGLLIRWSGRFKWLALYFGVPLTILGVGLMIHFRQPNTDIGYIVMCQLFIALSGGTLVICEQMAAMAVVSHQYVAVILAFEGMFSSVGGAIGSSISAAIWTGVFPDRLARYLPADEMANLAMIYADLETQLSYPVGSPTRDAIQQAYGDAQKYMLIAATAVLSLIIPSVIVWRDIQVKDFKQVKGRVV